MRPEKKISYLPVMIKSTVFRCLVVNKEIAALLDLANFLANAVHVYVWVFRQVVNSYLLILERIDVITCGKSYKFFQSFQFPVHDSAKEYQSLIREKFVIPFKHYINL